MQSGPQRGPDEEGRLHRQPPAAGVYLPVDWCWRINTNADLAAALQECIDQKMSYKKIGEELQRRNPAWCTKNGKPYAKSTLKDWKGYLTVTQG